MDDRLWNLVLHSPGFLHVVRTSFVRFSDVYVHENGRESLKMWYFSRGGGALHRHCLLTFWLNLRETSRLTVTSEMIIFGVCVSCETKKTLFLKLTKLKLGFLKVKAPHGIQTSSPSSGRERNYTNTVDVLLVAVAQTEFTRRSIWAGAGKTSNSDILWNTEINRQSVTWLLP